jgi:hypothetical protein
VSTTGGPGRTRSGPLRVLLAAGAALAVAAVAVVVVVRAGASDGPAPRPTSTIGRGTHICVVVGSAPAIGARFRVPLSRALWKAHREIATTGYQDEARRIGDGAANERFTDTG